MLDTEYPGETRGCIVIKRTISSQLSVSGITSGNTIPLFGSSGSPGSDIQCTFDSERFSLKNDRFGTFPIYYAQPDTHTLIISNYIDKILEAGVAPDLDDDALAVFVRLGYFVGRDTAFKQIRALAPNSEITVTRTGIDISCQPVVSPPPATIPPLEEAKREFGEIFQRCLEAFLAQHPDADIMLPISGGRDSRHILLALLKAGRPPQHLVTCERFAPSTNEDIHAARKLCDAVGLKQTVLKQSDDMIPEELNNFSLTSYCADENNWATPVANYFSDLEKPTLLFDGIAGDVLAANLYNDQNKLDLFKAGRVADIAEGILNDEGYLVDYLSDEHRRRWSRQRAKARLEEELQRYVGAANPTAHFYLWCRALREVCHIPRTYLGRHGTVVTPFFFEPVFDYMIHLPGEYFLDKGFHTSAIAMMYPEYADLPFAGRGGFRTASFATRLRTVSHSLRHLMGTPGSLQLFRFSYLLPRLLKGLLSPRYGTRLHAMMIMPLYVATLQRLASGRDGH